MAAAHRVLEMMLGMQFSGTCRYDEILDQFVWVDDNCLARSDADEDSFKRQDAEDEVTSNDELPTLLTKRWNDHVLSGSPEKKRKQDVVIRRNVIIPLEAKAWYREVFPFYVQHRLRKLARWRWNCLRDAVAFDDDFYLWCLFESNNRDWWSPFITDLNDRLDVSLGNMSLFYYYLCGARENDWMDLMAFESGIVAWRDSCDEIWKTAHSK